MRQKSNKKNQTCFFTDCNECALPLTTPPVCVQHVNNLELWYEEFFSQSSKNITYPFLKTMPDEVRDSMFRGVFSVYYEELFKKHPLRGEFYKAYTDSLRKDNNVDFLVEPSVYFVIAAAVTGILGNFAYDVVKSIVKKIAGGRDERIPEKLDLVVSEFRYECKRISIHGESIPLSEIRNVDVEELCISYRILVKDTEKKKTKAVSDGQNPTFDSDGKMPHSDR